MMHLQLEMQDLSVIELPIYCTSLGVVGSAVQSPFRRQVQALTSGRQVLWDPHIPRKADTKSDFRLLSISSRKGWRFTRQGKDAALWFFTVITFAHHFLNWKLWCSQVFGYLHSSRHSRSRNLNEAKCFAGRRGRIRVVIPST